MKVKLDLIYPIVTTKLLYASLTIANTSRVKSVARDGDVAV